MSVGASMIWDSPFGPLRFDFAYPLLKQWYDRTQLFHSAAERSSDRGLATSVEAGRMPDFFPTDRELTIGEIAGLTRAEAARGRSARPAHPQHCAARYGGRSDISFLDNAKYLERWRITRAGACLVAPRFEASAPAGLAVLVTPEPYRAFVAVARALFPARCGLSLFGASGRAAGAQVHPSARIEAGVTIDPLAVIGPRAEIGAGTLIAAGAVIGPDVAIGRDCAIGAGATILTR